MTRSFQCRFHISRFTNFDLSRFLDLGRNRGLSVPMISAVTCSLPCVTMLLFIFGQPLRVRLTCRCNITSYIGINEECLNCILTVSNRSALLKKPYSRPHPLRSVNHGKKRTCTCRTSNCMIHEDIVQQKCWNKYLMANKIHKTGSRTTIET